MSAVLWRFPDARRDSWTITEVGKSYLDDAIFNGDFALIYQGCISYLYSNILKLTGILYRPGKGAEHASIAATSFCTDGNFAN